MLGTLVSASADELAVTGTSATFATLAMVVNGRYRFCANVDAWILVGATPVAVKTAGSSLFVPAGVEIVLSGSDGPKCAAIADSSSGKASLAPVRL